MRSGRLGLWVVVCAVLGLGILLASSPAPADAPCELEGAAGPLGMAAVVDRTGDACVARWVRDDVPTAQKLWGVWAVRWMDRPEAVLPTLVTLAAGKDPDLAGAASQAILDVASRDELDVRGDEQESAAVVRALDGALQDTTLRADIRVAMTAARVRYAAPHAAR